ncbi:MAG: hypothetical protein ACK5Q3_13315 [Planctomycetota bacterium]
MDGRSGDGFHSAISTQHIHAGYNVDFAGNKPCGNYGAFAVSDRWAVVDGSD